MKKKYKQVIIFGKSQVHKVGKKIITIIKNNSRINKIPVTVKNYSVGLLAVSIDILIINLIKMKS